MFSLVCESYERGYPEMASFHAEIVKSNTRNPYSQKSEAHQYHPYACF